MYFYDQFQDPLASGVVDLIALIAPPPRGAGEASQSAPITVVKTWIFVMKKHVLKQK